MTHEQLKYGDFVKHINWVYHKTQDPPKVILIGKNSETVPLREYKLRTCKITRLDASHDAPNKNQLFDDFPQRSLFEDVTTEAINANPKLAEKYLGKFNVVILDDESIVTNGVSLTQAIIKNEVFLTHHGRFLFDLSINTSDLGKSTNSISYILSTVRKVNQKLKNSEHPSRFLVEDIKLSVDDRAENILGLRIYLKKELI